MCKIDISLESLLDQLDGKRIEWTMDDKCVVEYKERRIRIEKVEERWNVSLIGVKDVTIDADHYGKKDVTFTTGRAALKYLKSMYDGITPLEELAIALKFSPGVYSLDMLFPRSLANWWTMNCEGSNCFEIRWREFHGFRVQKVDNFTMKLNVKRFEDPIKVKEYLMSKMQEGAPVQYRDLMAFG